MSSVHTTLRPLLLLSYGGEDVINSSSSSASGDSQIEKGSYETELRELVDMINILELRIRNEADEIRAHKAEELEEDNEYLTPFPFAVLDAKEPVVEDDLGPEARTASNYPRSIGDGNGCVNESTQPGRSMVNSPRIIRVAFLVIRNRNVRSSISI